MNNLLGIWSSNPAVSMVIWVVMTMVVLYLGRKQAHQVLYGVGRALHRSLRMSSYAISKLEDKVVIQNQMFSANHFVAASGLIQFAVSALVLIAVSLGGLVNYKLMAGQMVLLEHTAQLSVLGVTHLVALVVVFVEVILGLIVVEALGLTRFLPMIGLMAARSRKVLAVVALLLLLLVVAIEVTLLPTVEQKLLGAVLPITLAFSAIPLASLIYSLRVIAGEFLVVVLRGLWVGLRVLGSLLAQTSTLCRHFYDLLIVIPLGVERLVRSYLDREVEIDVPMLTRVEAEALKSRQRKAGGAEIQSEHSISSGKATIRSASPRREVHHNSGVRKVIEGSSLESVDLSETMMRSSL